MKLNELDHEYKIYVDLDGVLVDFNKRALEICPEWQVDAADNGNKKLDSLLWKTVRAITKQGQPFWGKMDPTTDAHQLWSYVKQYNPEILTATGVVGNPVEEKAEWVKKHLGSDVVVHFVQKSREKANFARPNAILIDDRMKAIGPWKDAGGIGILHKSAAQSIQELKNLGL